MQSQRLETKERIEAFYIDKIKPVDDEDIEYYVTHDYCPFCNEEDTDKEAVIEEYKNMIVCSCSSCLEYYKSLDTKQLIITKPDSYKVYVYFVIGTEFGWAYEIKFDGVRFELDSHRHGNLLFSSKRMATISGVRDAYKNIKYKW